MLNPFTSGLVPITGPAFDLVPVTPSDAADLGFVGTGLYIQSGGQVTFKTAAGETRTVHAAQDNWFLPVGVLQVFETGTETKAFDWIWVLKPYGA